MLWSVIRLIFKTSSVTPDFFYVFNLILSFSTCSQSFKKICTWELLGANVLKRAKFAYIHLVFSLARDWSKHVTWSNIPQLKLGTIREYSPHFENRECCEKDLKDNKHGSLHLARQYMLGYLSFDIISAVQAFSLKLAIVNSPPYSPPFWLPLLLFSA